MATLGGWVGLGGLIWLIFAFGSCVVLWFVRLVFVGFAFGFLGNFGFRFC